jgi:hypothetical protein
LNNKQSPGPQAARPKLRSRFGLGKLWSISVVLLAVVFCPTLHAQTSVKASTLAELRDAVQKSDQTIVMKPGRYTLTALPDGFRLIRIVTWFRISLPAGLIDVEDGL